MKPYKMLTVLLYMTFLVGLFWFLGNIIHQSGLNDWRIEPFISNITLTVITIITIAGFRSNYTA